MLDPRSLFAGFLLGEEVDELLARRDEQHPALLFAVPLCLAVRLRLVVRLHKTGTVSASDELNRCRKTLWLCK